MNHHSFHADVFTVGELSRRTGIPIKAVRIHRSGLGEHHRAQSRRVSHLYPRGAALPAVDQHAARYGTDAA